jgi:hypothetical protein
LFGKKHFLIFSFFALGLLLDEAVVFVASPFEYLFPRLQSMEKKNALLFSSLRKNKRKERETERKKRIFIPTRTPTRRTPTRRRRRRRALSLSLYLMMMLRG